MHKLIALIALTLTACGTGTAEQGFFPEAQLGNGSNEAAASTDGCGGHGEPQCDQGSSCNWGLQACTDGVAAGLCYFCCTDAGGTCGDRCQGDDPSAGYFDPDCEPTPPPPCGGHGQPHCAWDVPCADGLQACSSGDAAGMCFYCCEDLAGTCGDRCQGDDSSAGYFDPDCEPECDGPDVICDGYECGGATNNCGEWISCGNCGYGTTCDEETGSDLGVCVCNDTRSTNLVCGDVCADVVLDRCGEPVTCPGDVWGLGGYGGFAMCGDDYQWHNPTVPDGPDGCVQVGSRRYEPHCDADATQSGDVIQVRLNCTWIRRCS